jgi:general secretion pathway protein B
VSLILDALRKADAERERGAVPGLHAQPAPPDEPAARAPSRTPPWLWAGIGVAVGLAVAVALFAFSRGAATPEPAAAAATPPLPTPMPMPAGSPAPIAATPAANAPPMPSTMPPLIAEPAPWPGTGSGPDSRKSGERAADANAPSAAGSATTPRVLTAESVPVAPEQLPENIRAQLPALTFGGSIYSSNAASRSLIVNGRLHRESEQVLPGLTLEQIKPKGAVFNFKGYRFEVVL